MVLIETPDMKMNALKKEDALWKEQAVSTQDTLEIRKVSPAGIFEIGQQRYSKTLEIKDVNYSSMGYSEQVLFLDSWNHVIDSFKHPFKLTLFNQRRNMAKMQRNILYPLKGDAFDDARECYNDIMKQKILTGEHGVEQHKYITLTLDKNGEYSEVDKAFSALENGVTKEFGSLGSVLSPLSGEERLQILHDFYRPGREEEAIHIEQLIENGLDWKNEVIDETIDFQPKQIVFPSWYARGLYIEPNSYGGELEDDFLVELASLSVCSVFSVDYVPVDKGLTKKVIEAKYMSIEHKISKQAEKRVKNKNFVSEPSYRLRAEKEEIEEMLEDVRKQGQRFFWVGVTMIITADSLEELDLLTTTVEQACSRGNCKAYIAVNKQRECLNTALPIGVRNFAPMRAMFTQSAAAFIPFTTMELMDERSPFYYGVNKFSKNPILFHRKWLMNPNGFIFGKSGSGKSFTGGKMEIGSVYLTTEDDIIILDPQNEYEDTCNAFCGTYINLSSVHINPLHCELEDFTGTRLKELIKEKSELMNAVAEHSMEGESMKGIKTIVDRCTKRMYEKIAALPEEQRYIPIMEHFYQAVQEEQEVERKKGNVNTADAAENLALSIERFVTGSLEFFNHQTNINMENRMVVFGIKDLGESLWGISMAIILSFITRRINQNYIQGKTTWFYMDECHYMTKKPHTKLYMIESWKTLRKFRTILTGLTQNASDLLKDTDTTTLVSNSEYTLFMKQSEKDISSILTAFENISEAQLTFLKTATAGTGVIRFGDIVIRMDNHIEKTNPIYDVFNTNPYEKMAGGR